MLAVIENDQCRFCAQEVAENVKDGNISLRRKTKNLCNRLWQKRRVAERSQLDQPNAIGIIIQYLSAYFQRQTRFANSSRTRQRDQTMLVDELDDLNLFFFAPDESGDGSRQIR